jgi:histone H3/H4
MPGPARRVGDGAESYARAVSRVACAQVVYAQAERLAESAAKAAKPSGQNTSTPRSAAKGRAVTSAADAIAPSTIFASDSVANALADIAAAFVTHVGRRSVARAELGGRTSVALTDVLACLQGMAPVTQSYTRDLARYAMLEEIPFPSDVPSFPSPIPVSDAGAGGGDDSAEPQLPPDPVDGDANVAEGVDEDSRRAAERPWIEPWMPPLPPSRTYKSTPGVVLESGDGRGADRTKLSTQRRQVEQSLSRLREGNLSNCLNNGGIAAGVRDVAASGLVPATHALAENPFLAPPKVGAAAVIDEDMASLKPHEPTEPVDSAMDVDRDSVMRDSNMAASGGGGEGSDPKRARVARIFTEARGTGASVGAGNAGAGAASAAGGKVKKSNDAMDAAP